MFIVYTLPFQVFKHPQVSYYFKSVKINRPLSARIRNVINIPTLKPLIELSTRLSNGIVFKAMFLVGHFGFSPVKACSPRCCRV